MAKNEEFKKRVKVGLVNAWVGQVLFHNRCWVEILLLSTRLNQF